MSWDVEATGNVEDLWRFRVMVAEDLRTLAGLQGRELDRGSIAALWRDCYDGFLGLSLTSLRSRRAIDELCKALTDIPTYLDRGTLNVLEADYVAIYDQDGGLYVPDAGAPSCGEYRSEPRTVTGDLELLARLLEPGRAALPFAGIATFVEKALLPPMERFAEAVRRSGRSRFYQGIADVTAAYLRELEECLSELEREPRSLARFIGPALYPMAGAATVGDSSGLMGS